MLYFVRGADGFAVAEKPPDGVIYPEIAFSADQKVKLVDTRAPFTSYKFPHALSYMPSLLKSNLQKAVRRRHIEEAFATTKHFLAQDAGELLRRLPIIMCEDTMLHPRLFLEIVWLMAAVSKGYALSAADCQMVMDFVGAALSAPSRYNIGLGGSGVPNYSDPLHLAFALRISYGGMKYDEEFMERLLSRIAGGELAVHADLITVDYESVAAFDVERHLLREAVDFHCFPAMLTETGVAKAAIWHNRSAPNVRSFIGLGGPTVSEEEAEARAKWALSEADIAVLEEFVDRRIAGLRGRNVAPAPKQLRLTAFVKRI